MTARKPVAPFYAAAVVWLVYALFFPLYRPVHFLIVIAASAAVFLGVQLLCASVKEPAAEPKKEEP